MLVLRAYTVMGRQVTEITCVGHGAARDGGGHLLFRAGSDEQPADLGDVLRRLLDDVELCHREWQMGALDETDDCLWA